MITHYKNQSLENIVEIIDGSICIEEWMPIFGYEKHYHISSFGRVKSLGNRCFHKKRKIKILKQSITTKGYLFVTLYDEFSKSKIYSVHRLVAIAYLENKDNLPEVNHLFGIKTDNRKSKLEWTTISRNRKHAYEIGLIDKSKICNMKGKFGSKHHNHKKIRQLDLSGNLIKEFNGTREASRLTGVTQTGISCVARGKKSCFTAGGFKWEYSK